MPAFVTSMKRNNKMNRSKLLVALMGGTAILAFGQFASATTAQTRADYTAAVDRASAVYKDASAICGPLAGHEKDMCVVDAKAVEKRAKASAEANYKGTIKSRTASQIANADADFMVAKVACDTKAGQEKNVCLKQAQATHVKLVADAKAHKTAVDARADAREETRDAQYKVALTKCDAMSSTEKDTCVTSAKSAYGK
jgi:hypothetical protein